MCFQLLLLCFLLCLSFLLVCFSFLHAVPTVDTLCYSLFLSIVFLHISFHYHPFIQKDLGFCRPNNVYWIKRILDPICLNLPKSFCKRFVFYIKSLSLALLSQPKCQSRFLFLFCFLWAFIALRYFWWAFGRYLLLGFLSHELQAIAFNWALLLMDFWVRICKSKHQHYFPYTWILFFVETTLFELSHTSCFIGYNACILQRRQETIKCFHPNANENKTTLVGKVENTWLKKSQERQHRCIFTQPKLLSLIYKHITHENYFTVQTKVGDESYTLHQFFDLMRFKKKIC